MSGRLRAAHRIKRCFGKGIDGINPAYYIKEKSPSTRVVLMTGDEKQVSLSKIKGTAVPKALFKPFTSAEMDVTVQRLLPP
jgi:hypothetical protein